jgi:hypothetical protein
MEGTFKLSLLMSPPIASDVIFSYIMLGNIQAWGVFLPPVFSDPY